MNVAAFRCMFVSASLMFGAGSVLAQTSAVGAGTKPSKPPSQEPAAGKPQGPQPSRAPNSALPDLSIPAKANVDQLEKVIATAKRVRPSSPDDLVAMQTAIRDASNKLVELMKDRESPRAQAAKLDALTSSVTLMTASGTEDAHKNIHDHLHSRKELTINDLQMGMLVATFLEMQPNKVPAKETYNLMVDLLAEDEREEMKSLRQNLLANVRRLDLLGNKFELKAKDLDGSVVTTDKYAGKFVIVDFFATWCEPCLAEVPRLRSHLEKYGSKGVEVIGISLDDDVDALKKYVDKQKLPWPVIHDGAENPMATLRMKFGVATLPTVMLLNKEGVVVSLEARGPELDRLMQRIFEQPTLAEPTPAEPTPAAARPNVEKTQAKSAKVKT